jgi:glycosyltransferase involved in cell wall biosynthesis
MIRLLFLIDSVGHEAGTENQLLELIGRLDRRRFDIRCACLAPSARLQNLPLPATAKLVFPLTSVFSLSSFRQLRQLRRYLLRERIDILHCFMVKSALLGVLAARGSRGPIVLTSRRNLGHWYTPFYLRVFRYLNRHTARVVANSEGARRAAIELEGVTPAKVDVLYNGVDLVRFAPATPPPGLLRPWGVADDALVVGNVSNYRPVKDLPLFLRAARLVLERFPTAVFLLVGTGPLRADLTALADQLGIASQVVFTDGQGGVAEYLSRMDVACLSSSAEGFSNAILEYMAAGLPVVATDVGGNAEAIADGETGFIVSSREPDEFANRLEFLLAHPARRREMGAAARARCERMFGLDTCIRRHEDYYEQLLALGGGR